VILPYNLSVTTDRTLVCAMQVDPDGDRTIVILVATFGNEDGGRTNIHPLPLLLQRYLHKLKYGYWIISEKEASTDEAGILNHCDLPVAHRVDYYVNARTNDFHQAPMPVHSAMGLDSLATWLSEVSIIHTSFFFGGVMLRAKELLHEFGDLGTLLGPPMRGSEGRRAELEKYIRRFDLVVEGTVLHNRDNRSNMAVLEPFPFPSMHSWLCLLYADLDNFLRTDMLAFHILPDAPPADPSFLIDPSPSIVLPGGARADIYLAPKYGIPYFPDRWPQDIQPSPYPPYGSGEVTLLGDIAEEYHFSAEMNEGNVSLPQHETRGEYE
jgi:hypothetical protein